MHVLTCRRYSLAASKWLLNIHPQAIPGGSHCERLINAGEIYVKRESQERT